jgi:hypothetical protein
MAITVASQATDVGSIPIARSSIAVKAANLGGFSAFGA